MTIRMVKSSQFGRFLSKQDGINEQGGNLLAGWQKNLKNLSDHALLHIRDFRVDQSILLSGCLVFHSDLDSRKVSNKDFQTIHSFSWQEHLIFRQRQFCGQLQG